MIFATHGRVPALRDANPPALQVPSRRHAAALLPALFGGES
jgi:hypothetical protein